MFIIKCGYGDKCKHGGDVSKEEAVKDKKRYWHKDCIYERNMKNKIFNTFYELFDSNDPGVSARGAISKYIHKLGYEPEYVMFCLKNKAKKLNSLHGLIYSLNKKKNYKEFKTIIAKQTKIDKYQHNPTEIDVNVVTIKRKKVKKWEDYFE